MYDVSAQGVDERMINVNYYSQVFHESLHGRCHVWPWLSEFRGFSLSCLTLSRLYFSGCIVHKIRRLVQLIVQGNFLFSVMDQESCEYYLGRQGTYTTT